MPKLKKIWVNTSGDRHELRMDWSNDRHQSVIIKSLAPEDVREGLLEASLLVAKEQRRKCL